MDEVTQPLRARVPSLPSVEVPAPSVADGLRGSPALGARRLLVKGRRRDIGSKSSGCVRPDRL